MTSGLRKIPCDFSPNLQPGSNGISRPYRHLAAVFPIAAGGDLQGGCLNVAHPFLERPARECGSHAGNRHHPADRLRRGGGRLLAGKRYPHRLQSALDSTALMLSKNAALQTNGALQTEATNTFNALFTGTNAQNVAVTASYSSILGSQLLVSGSAAVKTNFLSVLGSTRSISPLRRHRPGAIPGCGSRSCSTTPVRWRVPTR